MSKFLITVSIATLLFTGCSKYEEALKSMPNETAQANECKTGTKEFEVDCYELIAYKNSIALIRLGIIDDAKGDHANALKKYSIAKKKNNFYANSLIADLYAKGKGVKADEKKAIELLEETSHVDPIAAYKLAYYEINKKDADNSYIVDLLTYAGNNDLKQAQKLLVDAYTHGQYELKKDEKKAQEWQLKYNDITKNLIREIYGI